MRTDDQSACMAKATSTLLQISGANAPTKIPAPDGDRTLAIPIIMSEKHTWGWERRNASLLLPGNRGRSEDCHSHDVSYSVQQNNSKETSKLTQHAHMDAI
jgi:hypothetical protein